MIGQLSSDREYAEWIASVRVPNRRVNERPRISTEERAARAYDAETARMLEILHRPAPTPDVAAEPLPRVVRRRTATTRISDQQLEIAIRVYDSLTPAQQASWGRARTRESRQERAA